MLRACAAIWDLVGLQASRAMLVGVTCAATQGLGVILAQVAAEGHVCVCVPMAVRV